MPRKRSKKKRKPRPAEKADPLKVEFSLRGKGKIPTAEEARAIFLNWANGKAIPERIKIKFVRWQNPARKTAELRNWREAHTPAEIEEARITLRLRGWLHGAQISVAAIRTPGVQSEPAPHPARLRQGKISAKKTGRKRGVSRPKNARAARKKSALSQDKARMAYRRRGKGKPKRSRKSGHSGRPKKR